MDKLTNKQAAFVAEYLVDMNATQAAIRAGYSKKTARQIGDENLSKPDIRAAIDIGLRERTEKAGLAADLVYQSLVRELTFDPARMYREDGSMIPVHELDQDTRMNLQSIEAVQIGGDDAPLTVRKVKWNNPSSAREQAAKILGLYESDNKQKTDPIRELIASLPGNIIGPKHGR